VKSYWRIVSILAAAGLVACSDVTSVCTPILLHGLVITVQDSVTGGAPVSQATVVVRDVAGAFADSGKTIDTFSSAPERGGTYRIEIRAAGYRDWAANNVVVTKNGCHVTAVAITARLQRAP
jgi:hypothetical protein